MTYNGEVKIPSGLDWNLTPREAMEQQRQLAPRVVKENRLPPLRHVAGVDVGFEDGKKMSRAAAVVLTFPQLDLVESAVARLPVAFPYVPGLLSYRELPVVLEALRQLRTTPDAIIVDGHGYAHPRRFGIACYLGVLLDCVSIGCAKSILVGTAEEPDNRVGAWAPLIHEGQVIGAAVRSRIDTRPIFVSIGHKVDLETAIAVVLQCASKYRVPEPIRFAHRAAAGELLRPGARGEAAP